MRALVVAIGSGIIPVSFSVLPADDRKVDLAKLPPAAAAQMDFVKDILPIFKRSCLQCHRSGRTRQGGYYRDLFRLDVGRDSAMEIEGVIVPGKSESSRLIHHVAGLIDPMPPTEKGRLSSKEIGKLRAWIDQGAVWHKHTHKLPEGFRLVNVLVAEEFPTDGGEKLWAEFVEKQKSMGLKAALLVSEKRGEMLLSDGPLQKERGGGWFPFIPRRIRKVRVFIPNMVDAQVQVRLREVVKGKGGWVERGGRLVRADFDGKVVWSHAAKSSTSVLSPGFEVGYDGFPVLEVRVIANKDIAVGVSNIMVIAPTSASNK
jgi:hypothetical protein